MYLLYDKWPYLVNLLVDKHIKNMYIEVFIPIWLKYALKKSVSKKNDQTKTIDNQPKPKQIYRIN